MSPNPPPGDPRTLMAAVLFADLVGYSRKPVSDQFSAKGSFRELLQGVLAPLAPDTRMVLDTGDGAAIAFLADPEHALYVALELRARLNSRAADTALAPDDLRLGMNLGPVKRMVDLNGQPNLVGEGMNTAERVMSFASPGETTASRAFCDAIACLRESYRQMFEPLGQRADKHGREHEIFRVNATWLALEEARSSIGIGTGGDSLEAAGHTQEDVQATPASRGVGWKTIAGVAVAAAVLVAAAVAWLAGENAPPGMSRPAAAVATPANAPEARPSPPAHVARPADARDEPPAAAPAVEPRPTVPAKRTADPAPARAEMSAPRESVDAGDMSRCAALTQRAALGEALNPKDREELRKSCR